MIKPAPTQMLFMPPHNIRSGLCNATHIVLHMNERLLNFNDESNRINVCVISNIKYDHIPNGLFNVSFILFTILYYIKHRKTSKSLFLKAIL